VRRRFSKRVLLGLAGAVLIVATFAYLLPTIADYRDVWQVVKALSWEWIAALLAVAAVNVLTFAPPWVVLLPGLRFWPALMMTQATTALSIVVPGGAAVGIASAYGMLRRWGFSPSAVARSVTLVSLWNQLANLAYPIVALFLRRRRSSAWRSWASQSVRSCSSSTATAWPKRSATWRHGRPAGCGLDFAVLRWSGRDAASSASESTPSTSSGDGGTCSRSPRSPAA
jgi:uncharacterized membrane protein YbhN (UPF0104 family)